MKNDILFNFFILILPLSILSFWIIKKVFGYSMAKTFLILISVIFIWYLDSQSAYLLLGLVTINYWLPVFNSRLSVAAIGANLAFLFYFKYFLLLYQTKPSHLSIHQVIDYLVPLGISFYVFQMISYQMDHLRRKGSENRISFLDFSLYISFFPQLINGPIVRISRMRSQLKKSRLNSKFIYAGIVLLVIGMFKKFVIADSIDAIVSPYLGHIYPNGALLNWNTACALVVGLTSQIYFDFSGYSDMAVGIAYMLGFSIPFNFLSPYRSKSIIEGWGRWNITLTQFIRRYVYKELGRFHLNWRLKIFLSIMLFAVWHGPYLNFLLFGLLHVVNLIYVHQMRLVFSHGRYRTYLLVSEKLNFILILFLTLPLVRILDLNYYVYLMKSFFTNIEFKHLHISSNGFYFVVASFLACLILPGAKELLHWRPKQAWLSPIVLALMFFITLFFMNRNTTFVYFNF